MSRSTKPLTKALHTVRVVERIALELVRVARDAGRSWPDADTLLTGILAILDNAPPADSALHAACLAACSKVLK